MTQAPTSGAGAPVYGYTGPYYGYAAPAPSGMVSPDWKGSYDEWLLMVATEMSQRYARGDEDMLGSLHNATGPVGQPNINDKGKDDGSGTYQVSDQTFMFWYRYADLYKNDPWIVKMFGPPPERRATFIEDPNSASALQKAQQDWQAEQNEKERETRLEIARIDADARVKSAEIAADASKYAADAALEGVKIQAETDWNIAVLQDATNRYIAEGNWGVQKYIAELNDQGMDRRLQWELQVRREELAQRAIEERNRNRLENNKLALEIAKYDAELAASPRNWLKYAAWLETRDIVVNGLTLAMAAQEVDEADIDPATVAEVSGGVAAIETQKARQEKLSQQYGPDGQPKEVPFEDTDQPSVFGDLEKVLYAQGSATAQQPGALAQSQLEQQPPVLEQGSGPISAEDLENMDPRTLAQRLLGMNPMAGDQADASRENLQNIANSLNTSGGQPKAGFGAWMGPTTNALGIEIGEVAGKDVDYRKFSKLLPSQQQAKVGAIESVRGGYGVSDWVAEMERSRPKGKATGAVGFG